MPFFHIFSVYFFVFLLFFLRNSFIISTKMCWLNKWAWKSQRFEFIIQMKQQRLWTVRYREHILVNIYPLYRLYNNESLHKTHPIIVYVSLCAPRCDGESSKAQFLFQKWKIPPLLAFFSSLFSSFSLHTSPIIEWNFKNKSRVCVAYLFNHGTDARAANNNTGRHIASLNLWTETNLEAHNLGL